MSCSGHLKQESPPAWTQEAYRPLCREYSFCCPNWVPPPLVLTWPGGGTLPGYPPSWPGGYPARGYPGGGVPYLGTPPPDLAGGYPTWVPPGRVLPPSRVPPWLDLAGYPPPGVCPMEFWVMLQSIMGYGYPPPPMWTERWMDGQTRVKTLPSRRTTYAGGKNIALNWSQNHCNLLFC